MFGSSDPMAPQSMGRVIKQYMINVFKEPKGCGVKKVDSSMQSSYQWVDIETDSSIALDVRRIF